MKTDSIKHNRKAMVALLVCSGFIGIQPAIATVGGNATAEAVVAQQQQVRITGTVKDANGEPIIGANVSEKGTTNGIITDLDGKFTLNVASGATLVISYIGYQSQE